MEQTIRVLVVDDQELARQGLCLLLDQEEDIEVVGQAGDAGQAGELMRSQAPRVAVVCCRDRDVHTGGCAQLLGALSGLPLVVCMDRLGRSAVAEPAAAGGPAPVSTTVAGPVEEAAATVVALPDPASIGSGGAAVDPAGIVTAGAVPEPATASPLGDVPGPATAAPVGAPSETAAPRPPGAATEPVTDPTMDAATELRAPGPEPPVSVYLPLDAPAEEVARTIRAAVGVV